MHLRTWNKLGNSCYLSHVGPSPLVASCHCNFLKISFIKTGFHVAKAGLELQILPIFLNAKIVSVHYHTGPFHFNFSSIFNPVEVSVASSVIFCFT